MLQFITFLLALVFLGVADIQICSAGEGRGFEKFLQRHDLNEDREVTQVEFKGKPKRFEQLDLDGDGRITGTEFKQARRNRVQSDKKKSGQRLDRAVPDDVRVVRDQEYASIEGESLLLDLYLPEKAVAPPLIVWIHGGGWTRGDKTLINPVAIHLADEGFAIASLNFRLGGVAIHPKQIHDLKGAIRWLRANSKKYAYDATRIGVGGGSSGAHLALLLGLSGGERELEGTVGGNLNESSRVQAIVDLYGPSELEAYANKKPKFRRNKTDELLRSASPVHYLSKDDPPLLVLHGDQDKVIPLSQSQILHQRYQQAGLQSELYVIEGAGHGGVHFKDRDRYQLIKAFFKRHLTKSTAKKSANVISRVLDDKRPVEAVSAQPMPVSDPEHARLHGFHWMIGPRSGFEGTEERFNKLLKLIDRTLSTNPYITGVYIITHWRLLEQEEGRLNFDRLDRVIDVVRKHNRYYKLAVNPGIYSPDWLYTKGARSFDTQGSNPARKQHYQKGIRIPVPWDPVFQSSYYEMMAKLAERYGDDDSFRAITLTVATFMSPEWHLPKTAEDLRRWQDLEGFPHKLEEVWKMGIDRFAELFPAQHLILEASSYPLGLKDLGDAVVHHGATSQAGRFAVQINQLSGRFDLANKSTYRKLLVYKEKYGPQIQIGLQNVKGWGHHKARKQQGSKQMTTYNFVQAKGDYWELWYHDGKSRETCELLSNLQQEAVELGLKDFKKRLMNDGEYLPMETMRARRQALQKK